MKKSDLTSRVAVEMSLPEAAAEGEVNVMFSAIGKKLPNEETVSIAGFGSFSTSKSQARKGRNPRTGESIEMAASAVPSFKAGKVFRDAMG